MDDDSNVASFFLGVAITGIFFIFLTLAIPEKEPVVRYIYDTEARLVGFCNGKYLIRTEEDEFPPSGCMFIEPITLGSETDVR